MKLALNIGLILGLIALNGCVVIKDAQFDGCTINTSGWKSAAGQGNAIEATTTPNTNLNQ